MQCLIIILALVGVSWQDSGFVGLVNQNFHEKLNSGLEQQILAYHNEELAFRAYASYFARSDVNLPGFKKLMKELQQKAYDNAIQITSYINDRGGRLRFPVVQLKDACNTIGRSLSAFEVIQPSTGTATRSQPHICNFLSVSHELDKNPKKKKDGSKRKVDVNQEPDVKREDWMAGLYGLEDALALEKSINEGLINLTEEAKKFKDPHAREHLEQIMESQVVLIKRLADLVTRLRQYKQDNDYALGEYLLDKQLDS
ncbi:unnamed protein product [Lymnaea stagnalis]|uniref:Ferritin n=1 Tax=Lymnaea stagnalis TaxID=6523 RepID=A0AAV2ILX9_LYMST